MKIRLKKGEALALRTCREDGTASCSLGSFIEINEK